METAFDGVWDGCLYRGEMDVRPRVITSCLDYVCKTLSIIDPLSKNDRWIDLNGEREVPPLEYF